MQTRRVLIAANTQLAAQLAACNHESRKGLKAKLATARKEAEGQRLRADGLQKKLDELQPAAPVEA